MPKKRTEKLRLSTEEQAIALNKYSQLHKEKLMEYAEWKKQSKNAQVLIKDESFKQELKDYIDEMDAVANCIIDDEPRLGMRDEDDVDTVK